MPKRRKVGPPILRSMFEFAFSGPAVSAQARNAGLLAAWKARVAASAAAAWPAGQPLLDRAVEIRITEFSEMATSDRDNLAKPILDAMQGTVYVNDRLVVRLDVEWCNTDGRYLVRHMSPVVAAFLSRGDEFVWIRVFVYAAREDLVA